MGTTRFVGNRVNWAKERGLHTHGWVSVALYVRGYAIGRSVVGGVGTGERTKEKEMTGGGSCCSIRVGYTIVRPIGGIGRVMMG